MGRNLEYIGDNVDARGGLLPSAMVKSIADSAADVIIRHYPQASQEELVWRAAELAAQASAIASERSAEKASEVVYQAIESSREGSRRQL